MNASVRVKSIVFSVLSLLNVMFVPFFDVWGGLFPSDVDNNFFDVFEGVLTTADAWEYWVVHMTMSVFVPTVVMFFAALLNKRKLFLVSNAVGIILWFIQIIGYGLEDDGFSSMFDFDDSSIAIGIWIAIIIFFVSFLIVKKNKGDDVIDNS